MGDNKDLTISYLDARLTAQISQVGIFFFFGLGLLCTSADCSGVVELLLADAAAATAA